MSFKPNWKPLDDHYRLKSTGNSYYLFICCPMKIDGEWIDGLVYRDDTGRFYARTEEDFFDKFERVYPQ